MAEEREVECHLNLGLAGLPVDASVEREQLVERRSLDGRDRENREVVQRRGAPGGDGDARPEGLIGRNLGAAVGSAKMDVVALDDRGRKALRIARGRVLQVALQTDRLNLN